MTTNTTIRNYIIELLKHGGPGNHKITSSPQTAHNPHKKKSQATPIGKINAVVQGELPKSKLKTSEETKQKQNDKQQANQKTYSEIKDKDAKKYQNKLFDEVFSKQESDTLYEYSKGSEFINNFVRQSDNPMQGSGTMAQKIKAMDDAFEKAKASGGVPKDVILYRGIESDSLRSQLDNGTLKSGSILVDKGFPSTTIDKDIADSYSAPDMVKRTQNSITFIINTPKGTPAIYFGTKSFYPDEKEMLLDRNTPMKITAINKTKNGYELEVEVLPK